MKNSLFLIVLSAVFFTAVLFADAEKTDDTSSEEIKTEETKPENAELKNEPAVATEAMPQVQGEAKTENVETKDEAKPEEKVEMQNEAESKIEVELLHDSENSGRNLIFSARSNNKMTWNEAQDFCKKLNFWGEEWRLPNIDELREVVRNCSATESGGSCRVSVEGGCLAGNCTEPKGSCTCERKLKNRGFYSMFGDADYIGLWSSSTLSDDDKRAWGTVFYSGMIGSVSKDAKLYARCVSNPKLKAGSVSSNEKASEANVKIEPALGNDVIKEHTGKKTDDFVQCIAQGTREDKDFTHGWVSIDYIISPTGDVIDSWVQMSTVGNLTIENCIAEKIKEIKFPAPKHKATVFTNYSIRFLVKRRNK